MVHLQHVDQAEDGAQALEMARAMRYAAVVMDMQMPGMRGPVLAGRLQAARPDLRVLFMSGYTAEVINKHGILDEGVHFIQKPFSTRQFSQKIHEVLGTGK